MIEGIDDEWRGAARRQAPPRPAGVGALPQPGMEIGADIEDGRIGRIEREVVGLAARRSQQRPAVDARAGRPGGGGEGEDEQKDEDPEAGRAS